VAPGGYMSNGNLVVIDSRQADTPRIAKRVELQSAINDVHQSGSFAILSLGYNGVKVIDIAQ
jgi:hypothetical protein